MNRKHRYPLTTTILAALLLVLSPAVFGNSVRAGNPADSVKGTVILLHGLARTDRSMSALADRLEHQGYIIDNINYPSRHHGVPELAASHLAPAIARGVARGGKIHIVSHSMGAILIRSYLAADPQVQVDRIVMLAPPNGGSELIDTFAGNSLFRRFFGPAALQLATSQDALPNSLPRITGDIGVIAGTKSVNPLSSYLIPGPDDGAVSVQSTSLPEMQDQLLLPVIHTTIMRDPEVIAQVCHFLEFGSFRR